MSKLHSNHWYCSSFIAIAAVIVFHGSVGADVLTFQQGVGGYTGTQDTDVRSNLGSNHNNNTIYTHSGSTNGGYPRQGLLRFDNIIGANAGQIPVGSTIHSATLRLHSYTISDVGGTGIHLHRMLVDWQEDGVNWDDFKYNGNTLPGIQTDNLEASSVKSATFIPPPTDSDVDIDVTADLQAWAILQSNYGWALLVDSGNDSNQLYQHYSSNYVNNIGHRPELIINYSPIPEPGRAWIGMIFLIGLVVARARTR